MEEVSKELPITLDVHHVLWSTVEAQLVVSNMTLMEWCNHCTSIVSVRWTMRLYIGGLALNNVTCLLGWVCVPTCVVANGNSSIWTGKDVSVQGFRRKS